MKLDRVETGGEDRPNEVVVFLENRASRGGFGGHPFSSYIFSSLPTSLLVAFVMPFPGPLVFSSTFGPQPRQPCQLCQPRCGLSLQPVVVGYPHLGSALNYLMSYLFGSLREPSSSGMRHAGLFAAVGDLKERPTTIIYPQPLVVKRMLRVT